MIDTEPLTTRLGRELLALQQSGADDATIAVLSDELKGAFNCLRYLRKCYAKQSQGANS